MTKSEMTTLIAQRCGVSGARAGQALDDLFDAIAERLAAGEAVRINGFGTLEAYPTAERPGYDPRTGERITVAAGCRIKFRPAAALKTRCLAGVQKAARQAAE